jgi:chromosome segregation ATPase
MSDLVLELLLILLLAAALGWFLGRYLCKSGEYEERAHKQQLSKQLASLQTDLQHREQALEDARYQLNQSSNLTAELSQHKEGLNAQLDSLHQERDNLLVTLQELEVCHTRLNTLTAEFDLQRQQTLKLQADRDNLAGQLGTAQETLHYTSEQLIQTRQQNQVQQAELDKLTLALNHQQHMVTLLEKDRQDLQQVRSQYDAAKLHINGLEYEKQLQQGRMTTLQQEHAQLQQQCQSLRQDTLAFNDRLNAAMKDRDNLGHEAERLRIEKQDYIGRLRAISNVVEAISEMHVAPVLIEQWQPENETHN